MENKAILAAGCFWGVEETYRRLPGVLSTRVGYTGGTVVDASYEQVCSGRTGHAEAVEITYDPAKITYAQLLDTFWTLHDPTTLSRQGPDVGEQYRSAIFFRTPEQEKEAQASKDALDHSGKFSQPIVTQIEAAGPFYPAEEYHQQYLAKRGLDPSCHI